MSEILKVLIACEESQIVCSEFRKLGHEAYSCDLLPTSGNNPEWHFQRDVSEILRSYELWDYDLIIAHPPCTRLANSGVRWLHERHLYKELDEACNFFNLFQDVGEGGKRVCIENPIPHKYAVDKIDTYDQLIQPWQFGHGETKATCLWLYGLPKLKPTNIVSGREGKIWKMPPNDERTKLRSKTYPGIAAAIANQYSEFILSGMTVNEWENKNVTQCQLF